MNFNEVLNTLNAAEVIDYMAQEKLAMKKEASTLIDKLYKEAKMTIPTPEEAKKESKKKPTQEKSDIPNIECEVCEYEGPTNELGQCPSCSAIMGVKPKEQNIPTSPYTLEYLEPRSGISMQDAEMIGRAEESSFTAW